MGQPVLGVVYDQGVAGPSEILAALRPFAEVVLLVPDSPHTRRVAPLLKALDCPVVALDGDEPPSLDGVVTFSESRLALTAGIANRLRLPGHTGSTVAALTDKRLQRELLRAVDGTASCVAHDPGELDRALATVGLPAIVKPQVGEGSAFTVRATSAAGAHDAAETFWSRRPGAGLVVETLLVGRSSGLFGDYVSVELASQDGEHLVLAVTGKLPLAEPFRETGQFWPAALDGADSDAVAGLAIRALAALGVTDGVSHVEIKLTPGGPRVIEVNGRLGGNLNDLAVRSGGQSLIAVAGRIALGLPPGWDSAGPDRTYYQHYHLAPLWATRMAVAHGVADVRALPYADSYRLLVPAGAELRTDRATEPLDILCGTAAGPEEMFDQLAAARRLLSFEFAAADGSSAIVPAAALPDA